jgi:hypothetical protein
MTISIISITTNLLETEVEITSKISYTSNTSISQTMDTVLNCSKIFLEDLWCHCWTRHRWTSERVNVKAWNLTWFLCSFIHYFIEWIKNKIQLLSINVWNGWFAHIILSYSVGGQLFFTCGPDGFILIWLWTDPKGKFCSWNTY